MKECIILAGGLGTRLQSVVKDVPKCMAEINGNPFIEYLFIYLSKEKIDHIVLALGYKSEIVLEWINSHSYSFDISYVIEKEPLGTGGAIQLAFSKVRGETAMVINGDTMFVVDTNQFLLNHKENNSSISLALKPMTNFDRYGTVELNGKRIVQFHEKQYKSEGLINGGVYLIEKHLFDQIDLPSKYSFEKDILEKELDNINICGYTQNSYFIDIGIPEDYDKAKSDFKELFN